MDTEENLKALVGVLQQTFSPDTKARKAAEEYLASIEGRQGYSILLLKLLSIGGVDPTVQQAAGIAFKNFVKRHWTVIEGHPPAITIDDNDRRQIKTVIVDLMLSVPPNIQKQLAESLSIISNSDFPAQWPELLPTLIAKFDSKDFKIINGVLETANSIFRRYRHQYKSDSVLRELVYILGLLQEPLLKLAQATSQMVEAHGSAPDNLKILFTSLEIIFKIFYSLCYVDLPEYFEDHMQEWMMEFHKYLNYESQYPQLVSDDDEEEGILQAIQATICQNINLYIGKYEEEFAPFLATFVEDVWKLLVKVGAEPKNDSLASSAIGFLTSVSTSVHFELFKDINTLKSICEKIVIPNMEFRESDEEIFEDNPQEFIRRDIEGSDSNTRRRSACELVKGLRKHYEEQVTQIFSAYIGAMLENYAKNPKENWKSKDAAIYLVTALTVTSATLKEGTKRTNQFVDIVSFFAAHVLPELQGKGSDSLVLKADALKFATSFRTQLPREAYPIVLQLSIGLLESPNYVVHTYAAVCIERLLTVKVPNATGQLALLFGKSEIKPFLQSSLINLFKVLATQESKENDYVMKALMRLLATAADEIIPVAEGCVNQLNTILGRVYKNPTNPTFNHYLFESIAVLARNVCVPNPAAVEMLEKLLFPAFQAILQEDIAEFSPYVFQLMAYLLELHKDGASQAYMALFPHLLNPLLWSRTGNVPALVRLLQAYLKQAPKQIVEASQLEALLGVFQKLIASTITDHEGFFLLEAVIQHIEPSAFQQYLPNIFTLIFTRLQSCKTMKFIRSYLVFLSLFIARHGATPVMQLVDTIQPQLFKMVLESLWLPNIQKVSGNIERKMCAIAMTKLLTDCPQMLTEAYFPSWGKLLQTLISLFEEPEDESLPSDVADNYAGSEENTGYSTAYSQLVYAAKQDVDPFKDVDARRLLVHSLKGLSQAHPGKFGPLIQQYLQGPAFNVLGAYFQKYEVPEPYLH